MTNSSSKRDAPCWVDGEKVLPVLCPRRAVLGREQIDGNGVGLEVLEQRDGLVGAVRPCRDRDGGQLIQWRQALERVDEDRHKLTLEVVDLAAHGRRVRELVRRHCCMHRVGQKE